MDIEIQKGVNREELERLNSEFSGFLLGLKVGMERAIEKLPFIDAQYSEWNAGLGATRLDIRNDIPND